MTNPQFTLSPMEMSVAAIIGSMRNITSIRNKANDGGHPAERNWQDNIEAVCGEMTLAKWLNIYYDCTINTFKGVPDVGDFEVRTSELEYGSLIIRENDLPNRKYWLITGPAPTYTIRGWILGSDARRDEWWKNPDPKKRKPAWFVPQSALNPPVKP